VSTAVAESTGTPGNPSRARRHAVFHPLRVAAVDRLTSDSVAITFEVPEELREDYAFTQGQHLTLRTTINGEDVRRNYSICSSATSGRLRVAVKSLAGGAFSAYANSTLAPGDVLEVMTPTGRFNVALDPANAKHYCAVVAGSGITPILSILETTLEVEPRSRFTLLYGNRTTETVMFLEELQDLKDRWPGRLQLVHVLSREAHESELLTGRLDRAKLGVLLESIARPDDVDEWFLCGPFAMVQETRATLLDAGVDPTHVHMELFHVEDEAPVRPGRDAAAAAAEEEADATQSAVTALLDGRSTGLGVRPGERILDALLKVRTDAPYACKGGVCGTCRAKVVSGEVRMERNYALEDSEVAAGFVLACQSHPVTDEVTLDFDA
jgi:ring-1,2-phenylacetyl-CoA epoxidase subunit PaaE